MVYAPAKYFAGLTKSEKEQRMRRIKKGSKTNSSDPRAYRPFPTDKGKKVRKSSYTKTFERVFPNAKSLEAKAKATKVPLGIIRKVFDKGMAAWRTGHRPGASQQAWGYARVHSFLVGGKTAKTTDLHLVEEAKKKMGIRKWPIKEFRT